MDILFVISEQWGRAMDYVNSMKIFMNVADMESFTQAAESLSLPKATVSAAVQQLETQLGARLLNRTTRQVKLTQDGVLFYERCQNVLADLDELEGLFKQDPKQLTGKVRISMSTRLAKNHIIPRLHEFYEQYPNIEVELSVSDQLVDLVQEGIDFVIRSGELQNSNLIAKPLKPMAIANVCSPSYIKRFGKPKKISDLANHYAVQYASRLGGKTADWEYLENGKLHFVKMKGLITVNNTDAYVECCLAGLGMVQVPEHDILPNLKDGSLVRVLEDFPAEPMPTAIVYPSRKHVSRRAQALMQWIEQVIKEMH